MNSLELHNSCEDNVVKNAFCKNIKGTERSYAYEDQLKTRISRVIKKITVEHIT